MNFIAHFLEGNAVDASETRRENQLRLVHYPIYKYFQGFIHAK